MRITAPLLTDENQEIARPFFECMRPVPTTRCGWALLICGLGLVALTGFALAYIASGAAGHSDSDDVATDDHNSTSIATSLFAIFTRSANNSSSSFLKYNVTL